MQTADATSASSSSSNSLRRLQRPESRSYGDAGAPPVHDQGFMVRRQSQLFRGLLQWWYFRRLTQLDTQVASLERELQRLTDAGLKYGARDKLKQNQHLYEQRVCIIVRLKRLDESADRQP